MKNIIIKLTEKEARNVLLSLQYDVTMYDGEHERVIAGAIKKIEKAILYGVEETKKE